MRKYDRALRIAAVGSHRDRRGLTLVEVTVTMLILGILAAVASPAFAAALNHYRVEAAAARLAADLNYARRTAINTSTSYELQVTLSPPAYQFAGLPDPAHPHQNYAVNLSAVASGVRIVSCSFDGETGFTFNLYGLPLVGQSLLPLTSGVIVIGSGAEQRTIQIDSRTGKAEVL